MNGMTDDHKAPVLRIYTERTSDLGGIWAFKPFAMVHCEFVEVSSYNDERDALVAARAELAAVRATLAEIARQKRTDELMTELDVEYADFEGGYDACINAARAALQSTPAQKEQTE